MSEKILITCYVNPDLDGFACSFAYAEYLQQMGKNARPIIFGTPHIEVEHILKEYNINPDFGQANPETFSKIILVDSSDLDGIDKRIDPNKVIEIIDHRKINMSENFPNAKVQIEMVGAAATLIAEKFYENNLVISRDNATLLYGAITSNTLNFQAKVTTNRDIKIAKHLKNKNNFSDEFAHKMFLSKSDLSGEKLINTIKNDFADFTSHNFSGKRVGIAQIEMIDGLKLANERKTEIISEINKIINKFKLDIVFLSIIDLEANQNVFIAPNKETEQLIEKILNVKFDKNIAIRPDFIMRKEIVPLIKEELVH